VLLGRNDFQWVCVVYSTTNRTPSALFDRLPYSTSKLVWYNTFLLFVMSLIPLPTAFSAKYPEMAHAAAFYDVVMFLNALVFFLMRRYVEVSAKLIPYNKLIQRCNMVSTSLYALSVPLSYVSV
jgi:uncharacterized membrane protein